MRLAFLPAVFTGLLALTLSSVVSATARTYPDPMAVPTATVAPLECVAPDAVVAFDQAKLDSEPGGKFTVEEHLHMTGDGAKAFLVALVNSGAPSDILNGDEVVTLQAKGPDGEYVTMEHILVFANGCKIAGGFMPTALIRSIQREA